MDAMAKGTDNTVPATSANNLDTFMVIIVFGVLVESELMGI